MNKALAIQIVIVGGGIAGLWLLNRLSRDGYDVVLLEKNAMGNAQTLASQGIIHGGLKYALNGVLSPASSAIADMPARWRACLAGDDAVDLRGTQVLSEHYYMWSSGSVRSRLKTFLGSKALRGRIDALPAEKYPAFFADAIRQNKNAVKGTLYQLTDFVVDTPSLLHTLAAPFQHRILQCADVHLLTDNSVRVTHHNTDIVINAERVILCAGEGNAALLENWNTTLTKPVMQRRPLHMVSVRVAHPAPAYLHCIGDSFGMTPRLTITSHPCREQHVNEWVWYLGGELAESGVAFDSQQQQKRAQTELAELFPWVDFSGASWHCFFVNRAEPRVADLQRPDNAYVSQCGQLMVCWPTKLTLSPNLGDTVCSLLPAELKPEGLSEHSQYLASVLPNAELADAPWEPIR